MNETKYMIECITRDLILKLMSDKDMNMQEAVDTLYNSDTYENSKTPEQGFISKVLDTSMTILTRNC